MTQDEEARIGKAVVAVLDGATSDDILMAALMAHIHGQHLVAVIAHAVAKALKENV